jgi:hypothetical protein
MVLNAENESKLNHKEKKDSKELDTMDKPIATARVC